MLSTVVGSLCWFFSAVMAVAIGSAIPDLIRIGKERGGENVFSTKLGREMAISLVGGVIVIPVLAFAGHSFLNGRGRRGLIICLFTFGIGQLIVFLAGIK